MLITRRITIGFTVSLFLMMVAFASVNSDSKGNEKTEPAALADCAADVKNALAANFTPDVISRITVEVAGRTVTLTGTLNYSPTRKALAKTAKRVACVKKVVNNILIQQTPRCTGTQQHECCSEAGQCACYPQGTACPPTRPKK